MLAGGEFCVGVLLELVLFSLLPKTSITDHILGLVVCWLELLSLPDLTLLLIGFVSFLYDLSSSSAFSDSLSDFCSWSLSFTGVITLSLFSEVSLAVLSESLSSPTSLWSESSSSTTLMILSNASLSEVLLSVNRKKITVKSIER